MRNQESNPPLPPLLRGVTLVVVAVLLAAGGGLFFLPEAARQAWPWALGPFDELFLGVWLWVLLFGLGLALSGWSSGQRETAQ